MPSEIGFTAEAREAESKVPDTSGDRLFGRPALLVMTFAMPIALVFGVGLGWLASTLDRGGRLAVGNTGRTLSSVIWSDNALVVVGGGTTRSDLADLVDRSTLPWHRHISLLVIGPNSDQALGVLDVIRRGGVETVAVAGIPESEPIWDSLESEAIQHHTTIKYVNQATRVTVTPHLAVELVPVETTSKTNSEGAIVRVQAGSMRFSWISGISKNSRIPPADPLFDLRANVVIDADGGTWLPEVGTPALSFQPAAARSSAMTKPPSRFARTLDGGDQVQLRFNGNELRLPRGQVTDMHAVGSD
ncbi:MAG TPA: hypothetical protein VKU87_01540, partial [Thermomicrobiaceae bacterium]|nr:hypothetical protein [Thermomicrobiaceae bacterium]